MEDKKKKASILQLLKPYLAKGRGLLLASCLLSALSTVLTIWPLYGIWQIIKALLSQDEAALAEVHAIALRVLMLTVAGIVAYFIALILSHRVAFDVEDQIIQQNMERLIHYPLGYFTQKDSGSLRKTVIDGAGVVHGLIAHQLPDAIATLVTPIILLVLLLMIDYRLGIACLLPIMIGMGIMGTMSTEESQALRKTYMESLQDMSAQAVEYVRGIPVVKVFSKSLESFEAFYGSIIHYRDNVVKITEFWQNTMMVYEAVILSTSFFVVPLALIILGRGEPLGQVLANVIIYLLLGPSLGAIVMRSAYIFQTSEESRVQLELLEEMMTYDSLPYLQQQTTSQDDLVFDKVTFSYEAAEEPAVKDVSFSIQKGQRYAIVGPSGGGKTTLARLAARFWDVDQGEIRLGGVNLKNFQKEDLMRKISFVFQQAELFKGSLRENLLVAKEDASQAEIDRAIDLAGAREIIDKLPEGLETVIGTQGTYLSGGEQQRLAIARAFLKDASVLLLDEATAFVDPENERILQRAFKELAKDKTCLMIAHRLSTVTDADCILVMDRGEIVEAGCHEDLLDQGGLYREMWTAYQSSASWEIGGQS